MSDTNVEAQADAAEDKKPDLVEKVAGYVKEFAEVRPHFESFADILTSALKRAAKDMGITAIVEARAKEPASFAGKVIKKGDKYDDPVWDLTDLCGVRIITETIDDIPPVCEFIRRYFLIDEANSEDVVDRLGSEKFGYRSVHFIVSLHLKHLEKLLGPELAAKYQGDYEKLCERWDKESKHFPGPKFKAEIQVRTLIQHAWASFGHDRVYKAEFDVPVQWRRDANRVAATLEEADSAIARTVRGIDGYSTYYGTYMPREKREKELEKLAMILEFDKGNRGLAHKIARLAISLGRWQRAAGGLEAYAKDWATGAQAKSVRKAWKVFENEKTPIEKREDADADLDELRDPPTAAILLDYGWALWKNGKKKADREAGRECIIDAVALDRSNVDSYITLAETYAQKGKRIKARDWYERAYHVAPDEPRALCGFVYWKAVSDPANLEFLSSLQPSIESTIERCRERARVGVYLPHAYYNIALLSLMLGRDDDALRAYAKAVSLSDSRSPVEKHFGLVEELHEVLPKDKVQANALAGMAERLLAVCAVAQLIKEIEVAEEAAPDPTKAKELERHEHQQRKRNRHLKKARKRLEKYKSKAKLPFDRAQPVVIVAGGCDRADKMIEEYRPILERAFETFTGTIISGGTKSGIPGIVGDLKTETIKKVAYLPRGWKAAADIHKKGYEKPILTDGAGFSPNEAIQGWVDLLAGEDGIDPADVKLLGINGGNISGFEYRFAAALGAKAGVIPKSGRAAAAVFEDEAWRDVPGLIRLPHDLHTVKLFVQGIPAWQGIDAKTKDAMAKEKHDDYRKSNQKKQLKKDAAMAEWDDLSEELKNSNRSQVDHIEAMLRQINLQVQKVPKGKKAVLYEFSDDQIEKLAVIEHARWNVERLLDGWRLGKRDPEKKTSPYLVSWAELDMDIRKWDRDPAIKLPELLADKGFQIVDQPKAETPEAEKPMVGKTDEKP